MSLPMITKDTFDDHAADGVFPTVTPFATSRPEISSEKVEKFYSGCGRFTL